MDRTWITAKNINCYARADPGRSKLKIPSMRLGNKGPGAAVHADRFLPGSAKWHPTKHSNYPCELVAEGGFEPPTKDLEVITSTLDGLVPANLANQARRNEGVVEPS